MTLFFSGSGRWQVKFGALPTTNLPVKSHETVKPKERKHINIVKDAPTSSEVKECYKTLSSLRKD